jgi:hypothetical protein
MKTFGGSGLKRHLADVVLRTMLADVERSAAPVIVGA